MKTILYFLLLSLFISCSTAPVGTPIQDRAVASLDKSCLDIAKELLDEKAYVETNVKFAQKYSSFEAILKDPKDYFDNVKARFVAQKALTPNDPYRFDFSEYGIPVIKELRAQLDLKEEEFVKNLEQLKTIDENSLAPLWVKDHFPKFFSKKKMIQDQELGLKYLEEVKVELDSYLGAKSIDYKALQEISFFYSRMAGMFDEKKLNIRDRIMLVIDRHLQGYNKLTIEEEYSLYKERNFRVFHKDSPVAGFIKAQDLFEKDFADQDEFKILSLPTPEHLGPDIFMRLLAHDIYINGISLNPAAADGFVRPSGDFWLHDLRHSSAIYEERLRYMDKYDLSEVQYAQLQKRMDRWKLELDGERKKIEDKELRYAIGFFMFNFHHDRGIPMVPSSYLRKKVDSVPYLLYAMLKVSKQPIGFKKPHKTMTEAYAWLQDFWLKRLNEEMEIVKNSEPYHDID